MRTLNEIISIIQEMKPELEKNFKVIRIGIFGSFVRAEEKQGSDIDIIVELSEPIGLDLIDLIDHLEERIGIKVDLVTTKSLRSEFEEEIFKEAVFT